MSICTIKSWFRGAQIVLRGRGYHHGIVGVRHPGQLQPVDDVTGWALDDSAKAEIDRILRETITDPVGPVFMAPPPRSIPA